MGLGLTIVGGGALWANAALKDDEGYLTTKTIQINRTSSYAVVSEPADIHVGSFWGWDLGDLVSFKVEGSNNTAKDIFIGVAPESAINTYLHDVEYDEIIGFHFNPDWLEYRHHPGNLTPPDAPVNEDIWTHRVNGSGTQTLYWNLESGTWVLALMNADGSQGVDVSVIFGAKVPWLFPMGLGFVIGGVVALVAGPLMIFFAVRGPRGPTS